MIDIIAQPDIFCPNDKSRPIRWTLQTDEHIIQFGAQAFFEVTWNTTGASNGETITVAGHVFTVDNATPFTETTWSTTGTSQDVAQNFIDMLRSNYNFRGYEFFLSSAGGGLWTSNAFTREYAEQDDYTFDYSGLSISVTTSEINGQDVELANYQVWWQLFEDPDTPIGAQKYARVPYDPLFPFSSNVADIEGNRLVRSLLSTTPPDIFQNGAFEDLDFARQVELRFGGITIDDNGDAVFGQTYFSTPIWVANSVFQHHLTRDFRDHCPNFKAVVKWLTARPNEQNACMGAFEWVHVWIESTEEWDGDFSVRYRWYNAAGAQIGTYTEALGNELIGAYRIGVGHANAEIQNNIPAAARSWDVTIMGTDSMVEMEYSEVITRVLAGCNCRAAEIYFLEDAGSWWTVLMERLERRSVEQVAVEYERPIDLNDIDTDVLYGDGARYSEAAVADKTFTFQSERITNSNRDKYEQLLRSPEVYIKTTSSAGTVLRRIIPDRNNAVLFQRGDTARVTITYRFNTELLTH